MEMRMEVGELSYGGQEGIGKYEGRSRRWSINK